MIRRRSLVPGLVLALFVVAVCAVSLAHAGADETPTCRAVKAGSDSGPASPADLAGPLIGSIDLGERPPAASSAVPELVFDSARQVLAGPDVPRAPPV